MAGSLSPEQSRAYGERGYVFPIRIMPAEEAVRTLGALRATEARLGHRLSGRLNQKPHLLFPWADALVRHPAVLDAVESILGPDILCWGSQFFSKEARDPAYVSWHQDGTYWGLSSPDVVTAWIALTPSVVENGCMRVVPGTQREAVPHADTFAADNLLSRGQEVQVEVDGKDAVDIQLQPGEMSLHHVLIVHGSEPNHADYPRIGFAIRYVPTHVHQLSGDKDSALLVRGSDCYGHFELEEPPRVEMEPEAVERHGRILDRQLAILYRGSSQGGKLGSTIAKP